LKDLFGCQKTLRIFKEKIKERITIKDLDEAKQAVPDNIN